MCSLFKLDLEEASFPLLLSVTLAALLFNLLLLGLLKGVLGLLCCSPIGMWGLGLLVDLPRSIDRYEEKEFDGISVRYDSDGWPVHPVTAERCVRALPKKAEFCLNIVFFLAFPAALILSCCCCFRAANEGNHQN